MTTEIEERLQILRQDFASLTGRTFEHFYCPVLMVDEPAELCKAHVVNRAFPSSSRKWTVQRKDVDDFFGARFESSFTDLQFKQEDLATKAVTNKALYRRLRPRILLDGDEVEHFAAKAPLPAKYPELQIEGPEGLVRLGLKMDRDPMEVSSDARWEFEVRRDVRLAALVALLKAAHLTMFYLVGYGYALSPGGVWLGQILGSFWRANSETPKEGILRNAVSHFGPTVPMVRPVQAAPKAISGTVDDRWVHFCWCDDPGDRVPWALIVYVRTVDALHAVLLPVEHPDGPRRFQEHLQSDSASFDVSIARFEESRWSVDKRRSRIDWPAAAFNPAIVTEDAI